MADSSFRSSLNFLADLGIFDVVLPFLLVFTIVFAMLEKTKIFGIEKHDGHEYTKKNLNALTAFVIAFFTIASSQLVATITSVSANMVILLLASVLFLLLVGSFHEEKEGSFFLDKKVKNLFIGIMGIGLLGIFLNAITTSNGDSWLEVVLGWLADFSNNDVIASVVLIIIVVGVMFFVVSGSNQGKSDSGHGGSGGPAH